MKCFIEELNGSVRFTEGGGKRREVQSCADFFQYSLRNSVQIVQRYFTNQIQYLV